MKIETVLSPSLFNQIEKIEEKVVVVIDILRATSTICTILQNGASAVIPVREEELAREYKAKNYLVGGERSGETIPGFDFGNSPFHYTTEIVKNKEIVLTTTNGTKCLEMAKDAKLVYTGAFLHLNALGSKLEKINLNVVLFCAGWKDRINLEDSLFAGAVASLFPNADKDDATLLCENSYSVSSQKLFESLKTSNHFNRLANKGVVKDIAYCCQLNQIDLVPQLLDNMLISS